MTKVSVLIIRNIDPVDRMLCLELLLGTNVLEIADKQKYRRAPCGAISACTFYEAETIPNPHGINHKMYTHLLSNIVQTCCADILGLRTDVH